MKKSRFFCLLCAFIPGAGEMYMGLMKRGASLMLLFCVTILLAIIIPPLLVLLPVIWFYSFFDTLNVRNLSWEELRELTAHDDYVFTELVGRQSGGQLKRMLERSHLLIGWVLVGFGVYALFEQFRSYLWRFVYENESLYWVARLLDSIPTVFVGVLLIAVGIRFILGGKKKATAEDDFTPYLGESAGQNSPDNQKGV